MVNINRGIFRLFFLIGIAAAMLMLPGCGGGGGGAVVTPPSVKISTLSPTTNNTVTTAYSTTVKITATVENSSNTSVTFKLTPSTGASLVSSGDTATFTAGTASGTYTVTVTPAANPAAAATLTIKVVPITIAVSPSSATVNPSGTILFSALVQGSSNAGATFTASAGTVVPVAGSSDSANYTAPTTAGQYTVTATAAANSAYTSTATVTVTTQTLNPATVKGTISDNALNKVAGVVIQFFDASGNQVAQATSGSTGAFTASVPTTAVSFNLSAASIQTATEYEAFSYGKKIYDPLITSCGAPLPTLTSGGTSTLAAIVLYSSVGGPPPPPPDGCSQ